MSIASYLVVQTTESDADGLQASLDRSLGYPKPGGHRSPPAPHYTNVEANLAGTAWRLLVDSEAGTWDDGPPPTFTDLPVDPLTGLPVDIASFNAVPTLLNPDDPLWRDIPE